jgi:hypothetical protein
MKNSTEEIIQSRLHQLIAEVDGSSKVMDANSYTQENNETTHLLSMFFRWSLFGLLCLGVGYGVGQYNANIYNSLNQSYKNPAPFNHDGWRTDGTGIFYRWCRDSCHAPRLYGGGVIQVFEVHCSDRPCGDMAMGFNVLNAQGQTVDKIILREKGMQGELRRFLIETQNSDAATLELSDFQARARV